MRKKQTLAVILTVGALAATGCGNKTTAQSPETTTEAVVETSNAATETQEQASVELTEELKAKVDVVKEVLGDEYYPNMEIDAVTLADVYGVAPDLYTGFFGEMPMISANIDSFVAVEAKEGKAEDVVAALTKYRDNQINNALQYPSNAVKIQASTVFAKDNMVYYIALFGDTTEKEENDDELLAYCQEKTDAVVAALSE